MLAKILIYMVLFFLIASPSTFKLMRKILGSWVASAEGLPHAGGLALHSVVYVLLACYLPAKLVSSFEVGVYTSNGKAAPQFRGNLGPMLPQTTVNYGGLAASSMDMYVGEYGASKNPFSLTDPNRSESANAGSYY
jgi:hypothetical protein